MATAQENYYQTLKRHNEEINKNSYLLIQIKNKLVENNINIYDEVKAKEYINTLKTKNICLKIYNDFILNERG